MNVKTIALSGAEMAVTIGGSHAEVKNNGTDIIYASANSGIVAGADGVVSIPAGSAVTVLDTRGEVCLLGTGSVEVIGKDFVSQVFKPAASSGGAGGTEDEVARNAINAHAGNAEIHVTARDKEKWNMGVGFVTFNSHVSDSNIHTTAEEKAAWNAKADLSDIPTSLPANGGNADTANQIKCVDIIGTADTCTYHTILDWANHYSLQGCSAWAFIIGDYGYPDDAPEQYEAVIRIESDISGSRRLVTWSGYGGNVSYVRSVFNNAWYGGWGRTNDGGNAASVGTYTEEKIAAIEARIAALEGK